MQEILAGLRFLTLLLDAGKEPADDVNTLIKGPDLIR